MNERLFKGATVSILAFVLTIGTVRQMAIDNVKAMEGDFSSFINFPEEAQSEGRIPKEVEERFIRGLIATENLFLGKDGEVNVSFNVLGKDGRLEHSGSRVILSNPDAGQKLEDLIKLGFWGNRGKIGSVNYNLRVEVDENTELTWNVFSSSLSSRVTPTEIYSSSHIVKDLVTGFSLKSVKSFDVKGLRNFREDGEFVRYWDGGKWYKVDDIDRQILEKRFGNLLNGW